MTPDQHQTLLLAISHLDTLCRALWETRDDTDQRIRRVMLAALTELHLAIAKVKRPRWHAVDE